MLVADVCQRAQVWRCSLPPVRAFPGIAEDQWVHPQQGRESATLARRNARQSREATQRLPEVRSRDATIWSSPVPGKVDTRRAPLNSPIFSLGKRVRQSQDSKRTV